MIKINLIHDLSWKKGDFAAEIQETGICHPECSQVLLMASGELRLCSHLGNDGGGVSHLSFLIYLDCLLFRTGTNAEGSLFLNRR